MRIANDHFLRQFTGIVLLTLVPVILTAFLSIPFNLGRHPGETPPQVTDMSRHMT
ncbi:MAG: hypothetical protein RL375_4062 [Pseudomonadota bacterium]|jgi:hypothetical protein